MSKMRSCSCGASDITGRKEAERKRLKNKGIKVSAPHKAVSAADAATAKPSAQVTSEATSRTEDAATAEKQQKRSEKKAAKKAALKRLKGGEEIEVDVSEIGNGAVSTTSADDQSAAGNSALKPKGKGAVGAKRKRGGQ